MEFLIQMIILFLWNLSDRWFFSQDENLFEHETHLYSDKVFIYYY